VIRETCSCGATYEFKPPGTGYSGIGIEAAARWRRDHKCVEPVTILESTLVDSGPGLADVVDRLTAIAERLALLARVLAK
jgi:hypothetical protein